MNHLYKTNQKSATPKQRWDLLKSLYKDRDVNEVNKRLQEIALGHRNEITSQQDIAEQRAIIRQNEIHKVALEIYRNKFSNESSKGLWQKVLQGHHRLFPNFLNSLNTKLDSPPTSSAKLSVKQKEVKKTINNDRRREERDKKGTFSVLRKCQQELRRPLPRPKTRLLLSAPKVKRIRKRPASTSDSTRSTLMSQLTQAVGSVSQRKLCFLSRSYLELENQIHVERRKNRQQLKSCRSLTPDVSLPADEIDDVNSVRSIRSRPSQIIPATEREQKLRKYFYLFKIQQTELQEKVNKFCDDISKFTKKSPYISENVLPDNALSIGMF
ncbi:hypothetical protein EWB00_007769 [Schistosoma japonicum]|uniref:Uncharacterized protein n=1 Tax=Schistosoma japonicum TaxID=6182 RepID=A0A4Z2CTC1_SCHJA|nr:hypothetical protein KSF78_0003242 [Schistosoma japonicum]TNN07338.1 hypothetical protein EWB00_007769 [Schistosoma japonicum]